MNPYDRQPTVRGLPAAPASKTCQQDLPADLEANMPKLSGYGSLAAIAEEQVTDKIRRKLIAGDNCMLVIWQMAAGAHAAAHQHPHEQIFWMLKGKMEFRLGNERRSC